MSTYSLSETVSPLNPLWCGLPIAGEWEADNKLDNAGENIKLSFGAGTPIIEVTYDDKEPWPLVPTVMVLL